MRLLPHPNDLLHGKSLLLHAKSPFRLCRGLRFQLVLKVPWPIKVVFTSRSRSCYGNGCLYNLVRRDLSIQAPSPAGFGRIHGAALFSHFFAVLRVLSLLASMYCEQSECETRAVPGHPTLRPRCGSGFLRWKQSETNAPGSVVINRF